MSMQTNLPASPRPQAQFSQPQFSATRLIPDLPDEITLKILEKTEDTFNFNDSLKTAARLKRVSKNWKHETEKNDAKNQLFPLLGTHIKEVANRLNSQPIPAMLPIIPFLSTTQRANLITALYTNPAGQSMALLPIISNPATPRETLLQIRQQASSLKSNPTAQYLILKRVNAKLDASGDAVRSAQEEALVRWSHDPLSSNVTLEQIRKQPSQFNVLEHRKTLMLESRKPNLSQETQHQILEMTGILNNEAAQKDILKDLALNPSTSEGTLKQIFQQIDSFGANGQTEVLSAMASNPKTPIGTLTQMIEQADLLGAANQAKVLGAIANRYVR